ncbi:MAG: oligopeptide ABC transporter ATP-binding protein [Anaerolineales bacterium]|nr:ABC transporter ATP-binding protein [Anaerolineae bacterium]PWB50496.1 MAG: oligopeptide ABC transporter ATP-binding protein [Anaerolineales bacterium]
MPDSTLLSVINLYKYFPISQSLVSRMTRKPPKVVHAVDDVSFTLDKGEILALVGESGSGKTTVGMNILGLQIPSKGKILFDGIDIAYWSQGRIGDLNDPVNVDLAKLNKREQILLLRKRAQMVFQDPYESLDPRQKILEIVAEPLDIHGISLSESDRMERVRVSLESSGLAPADHFWGRYPDGLSGGQRQRVVIAGALVLEPQLLIADEPVSMLDVSIRAEFLTLLLDLRNKRNITIIYTTHDLATAGIFTDRIAVMYLGRIVELGPTKEVLANPQHPYTRALVSVLPAPNPRRQRERVILSGEVPNPINVPPGCRFHPRCPVAHNDCREVDPDYVKVTSEHQVACLYVQSQ